MMTPRWALVLGASSGFGEATARALAKAGYDIAGVHLDRKAGLKHVEEIVADITAGGRRARFFNLNAADDAKRQEVLDALEGDIQTQGGTVAVLMHSLAFGTLKPYIADDALTRANIEMTLDVMANSLVYWAQDLIKRRLMGQGGRIFSMTSSGSTRVIASYGAVSAAKCTLESHTRQLAVELAPHGVTVNALRGGVTRTPAAEKIPESHRLFEQAEQRNPHRRLTTTQDLARAVVALCQPGTDWITGNVINVDGGEEISG
ncbi:MAG: SDR family oxidoreductase [Gemmatimonadetes bacterium]|nr:SDR family oxidoreductase [Gemmatimonadota bacterium]MBI2536327.1 SDR family oxidoreductase [Gemmatimonadota bacterium]